MSESKNEKMGAFKCPLCKGKGKTTKQPTYKLSGDALKTYDQRGACPTVVYCEECNGTGYI